MYDKFYPDHPTPYVVKQYLKVGDDLLLANGEKVKIKKIEDYCYKILGTVSPNAKFVKDGKYYEVKKYTTDRIMYKVKCTNCKTFK